MVLHELRGATCRRTAIVSLYAGMGATAAASAVIGSSYLVSFYAAKRLAAWGVTELAERKAARDLALEVLQRSGGGEQIPGAVAMASCMWVLEGGGPHRHGSAARTFASITDSALGLQRTNRGQQSQQGGLQRGQQRNSPRVVSAERIRGQYLSREGFNTRAGALQGEGTSQPYPSSSSSSSIISSNTHNAVTFKFSRQTAVAFRPVGESQALTIGHSSGGAGAAAAAGVKDNPWIDTLSALFASVATSVLEGPVEVFRHRLQVNPDPFSHMNPTTVLDASTCGKAGISCT